MFGDSRVLALLVVCILVVGNQAVFTIDCSTVDGADGTIFDGVQCACQPNHNWSPSTNVCEVDCSGVAHSTATSTPTWSVNYVCPC